ncbi:hypothetical protein [Haladaptatus sp. NG-WS-4]
MDSLFGKTTCESVGDYNAATTGARTVRHAERVGKQHRRRPATVRTGEGRQHGRDGGDAAGGDHGEKPLLRETDSRQCREAAPDDQREQDDPQHSETRRRPVDATRVVASRESEQDERIEQGDDDRPDHAPSTIGYFAGRALWLPLPEDGVCLLSLTWEEKRHPPRV